MVTTTTTSFELSDEEREAIAAKVWERLLLEPPRQSPWMRTAEAAEYLRCPMSRLRKLTMLNRIPSHRDGRRVLYHRDDLDAFIRAGGASSH